MFPLLAAAPQDSQEEGWRQAVGARGANMRFQAQMGQRWPFNLARGPAESLIKPWAVKTEQTAKPMPETDTQSLSLPLFLCLSLAFSLNRFISLFFSIIPFHFLAREATGKNVTHGLRWHSWVEVWGEKRRRRRRRRVRRNVWRCFPSRARPCGPRQDGDGSCQLGARVRGSQKGDCGFEGILA